MAAQALVENVCAGDDHMELLAGPRFLQVEGDVVHTSRRVILLHCSAAVHAEAQAEARGGVEQLQLRHERRAGRGGPEIR